VWFGDVFLGDPEFCRVYLALYFFLKNFVSKHFLWMRTCIVFETVDLAPFSGL